MTKKTISISIIGHNEAKNLPGCFESITWADEIVFVDCGSDDNSIDIAKKYTSKVFSKDNNRNLNINKQFGIDQCASDWIFYLDPDEIVPEETAFWIKKEIQDTKYNAYQFNRKNHMLGRWLKYGGQYPDTQLRLFERGKAKFPCKHVHEKLEVTGNIGRAPCDFLHHPYPTLEVYISKFNFYTTFEASFLLENSSLLLPGLNYLLLKPLTRFIKRYILYRGFLDGYAGFVAAFFDMINFPVRYLKYIEMKNNRKK
jgi:glycosyltransferase involved in cell wall biosynthesis